MEEGDKGRRAPDVWIAKDLNDMLQLVTQQGHEFAARGAARVHEDAQEPVWLGHVKRHVETRPNALLTRARCNVDQTIGGVDGVEQTFKGW
jgi:hypothetical protein